MVDLISIDVPVVIQINALEYHLPMGRCEFTSWELEISDRAYTLG